MKLILVEIGGLITVSVLDIDNFFRMCFCSFRVHLTILRHCTDLHAMAYTFWMFVIYYFFYQHHTLLVKAAGELIRFRF